MTDKLTPERRSDNMRMIRARHTSPEITIRKMVHTMGFRFRLHVGKLPGKPDLVFPKLGKIIDVRGCFWHQHKGCVDSHIPKTRVDYWRPKLLGNKRRDRRNERSLRDDGWRLLVVWECELRNLRQLTRRLAAFLGA